MSDERLGGISLSGSAELVFSVGAWKGQPRASVRKFVASARYTGATPSGLSLRGDVLAGILESLEQIERQVAVRSAGQMARVAKSGQAEIVISMVAAEGRDSLPSVDVREFVQTANYTGPTKKGVRFTWDKLPDVIALMRLQIQRLGAEECRQPTLFPEARPQWVEHTKNIEPAGKSPRDAVLADLLPNGPKRFPEDFLKEATGKSIVVDLPTELISVTQERDGHYALRSEFGFSRTVRNAVEGSFFVYAQLRGLRSVAVPGEMIELFRAVKAYENYLRDLQRSLLLGYQRQSDNRAVAEHQARRVCKDHGLPWLERS